MRYVIANWKQNKTLEDVTLWCNDFFRLAEGQVFANVTPIICPPFSLIELASRLLNLDPTGSFPTLSIGAQDVSPYADGAHTGFVGVDQLKQFCTYAIVGHSERQETRDLVIQKAHMCLENGIVPVVCFKSTADYRLVDGAIYALEDPDNISTGGIYRPKALADVIKLVNEARGFFGLEAKIIYGGSVNSENAEDLASLEALDGVLVGNASLNPAEFIDIVRKFS